MPTPPSLPTILSSPTAAALWQLRSELLELELPESSGLWTLLDRFHGYLDGLETTASSRDYSELASKLDISAISGVILEQLAEKGEASEQALRLLSGILSEGLMALATRQHVRAWEGELGAHYRHAAWFLYEQLWHWTQRLKPELPPDERRQLLELLLAPIHSAATSGMQKAVLIGRLFQIVLVGLLSELIPDLELGV
jgi:hypothetical protein